mmetsp:Transcript_17037/g.19644  ORF Transcript_17037/g.19644 Transcript_17037/m.19644 type:complete len:89 (+) Transcript_17037:1031-1297(+)
MIITKLNSVISKMTEEIKVMKAVLKSPHLYSKLNEYTTRQMNFEKLKQGIDRHRSGEHQDNYKMFEKIDIDDFASTTIQSYYDSNHGK